MKDKGGELIVQRDNNGPETVKHKKRKASSNAKKGHRLKAAPTSNDIKIESTEKPNEESKLAAENSLKNFKSHKTL